jgi:hypothetical protein
MEREYPKTGEVWSLQVHPAESDALLGLLRSRGLDVTKLGYGGAPTYYLVPAVPRTAPVKLREPAPEDVAELRTAFRGAAGGKVRILPTSDPDLIPCGDWMLSPVTPCPKAGPGRHAHRCTLPTYDHPGHVCQCGTAWSDD